MIKIIRRFTKLGQDVYDTCQWKKVHCKITEPNGKVVFELANAEFPEHYSQVACEIVASKYFRRAGVPSSTVIVPEEGIDAKWSPRTPSPNTIFGGEISLKDCINRMVGHWTYWAAKMKIVDDLDAFADELKYMILHQYWSPNSPQWFNTGLSWAYGVKKKNEGYYTIHGEYKDGCYEQAHACFIQPVEDQMFGENGIFEILNNEARIFKKGSGTGTNFSKLRAKNERLSGGGKSSGVLSYLKIFDRSADCIKSGGTTRRSAKMVILDLDHPDIEEFIEWKSLEETKVASLITGSKANFRYLNAIVQDPKNDNLKLLALRRGVESNYIDRAVLLGKMGYKEFPMALIGNDFNGDGYGTVSGQNSNNTVSIRDSFFKALETPGGDWYLISRLPAKSQKHWEFVEKTLQGDLYKNKNSYGMMVDGKIHDVPKMMKASELMEKIAFNAWQSADPGVHFRDTINDWHTCLNDGEIRSSNPCSEYLFLDNTACNLSSHRLTKHFVDGCFDIDSYAHAIRLSQIVLDISVESALLPSKGIGEGTAKYRTTGNGYADIGALLMRMGIPYDSDKGRAWIAALTSLLTSECYIISKQLADIHGPYEAYERNKEHHRKVIENHMYAAQVGDDVHTNIDPDRLDTSLIPSELAKAVTASWIEAQRAPNGYRNAHVTVIAPTGTIGIQMDCDTTGIEPDFSLKKWKKLSGGGYLTIVNQSVPEALRVLGYEPDQIQEIIKHYDGTKSYPGIDPEKIKASMHVSQLGLPESLQNEIYGHGTLRGSALKDEHLKVFDCANDISWKGHVLAMAAAQPFLSGSISKTINMPHDATVNDVKEAYIFSWKHALKCNAIYRDGSKLSQPLNLKLNVENIGSTLSPIDQEIQEMLTSGRGHRIKPPARRAGWTDEFEINGFKYYLRHNVDANNKLIELWVDAPNESSSVRTALNTMCRFVSKGLQYGMPVEEVVDTFIGIQQDPRGLVRHENIKVCKSIYDAIGRFIAYMYLGKTDMTDVETEMLVADSTTSQTTVVSHKKTTKECPRCSSVDISMPSSCKNHCKTCGYSWGGCGE
jgi:ribonucleoside-diphosphate reductase alpha chain